jgi:type II secretory pathway pseudopilin PulG
MNNSSNNHKGFTLIETLFAVLLFSASLVSLMAIAGRGIAAANSAREQTTAHYLAQEGLEVVRNIRDSNFMNQGWDTGFSQCTQNNPCHVEYTQTSIPTLELCQTDPVNGCQVGINNDAFVNEGEGSPSGYLRKIYVIPGGIDPNTQTITEYQVVSKISWKSKTVDRAVTLETLLKKWQ